jgi:lipoyl(octanoyl) transferase
LYENNKLMYNKELTIVDWGLIDYKLAWERQEVLFESISAIKKANRLQGLEQPTPNYIIFCQHPPVYTLGKGGGKHHLLMEESELEREGIALFHINRGGSITYHGPGQLVVYVVLDLENFCKDVHAYLRLLEQAVVATLAEFGIEAVLSQGFTGVWAPVGQELAKICAIGVRIARWITMHGLALNVATDLRYFEHIVPCGLEQVRTTSMQELLGESLSLQLVAQHLSTHLSLLLKAWGPA